MRLARGERNIGEGIGLLEEAGGGREHELCHACSRLLIYLPVSKVTYHFIVWCLEPFERLLLVRPSDNPYKYIMSESDSFSSEDSYGWISWFCNL